MGACHARIRSRRSKVRAGFVMTRNVTSRNHSTVSDTGELTARGTTRVPATLISVPSTRSRPAPKPTQVATMGFIQTNRSGAPLHFAGGSALLLGTDARLGLGDLHAMAFGALHVRGQWRAAPVAVHQLEPPRVALQQHAEIDQADQ